MSRRKSTTKLPYALQRELGLEVQNARGRGQRTVRGRKDQRKTDRVEKRQNIRGRGPRSYQSSRSRDDEDQDEGSEDDVSDPELKTVVSKVKPTSKPTAQAPQPKSILKQPKRRSPSPESFSEMGSVSDTDSDIPFPRDLSPEIVLDASSRSYKDRLAEDEDDIAALEKKLGLRKKQSRSAIIDEDGLRGLLGGLDGDNDDRKRKRQEREWLQRKRRRREDLEPPTNAEELDGSSDLEKENGPSLDSSEDDLGETDSAEHDQDNGDDFADFSDDGQQDDKHDAPVPRPIKLRENPYVAPMTAGTISAKYIPPSLRKAQNGENESLQRLKRQLQGQVNKLSEANLVSILNEIENIYRSNARQDVTSTLIDLLLGLLCDRAALQSTFVLLHAAFCVAIYKVIGTDFGAELLARLVDRLSEYHKDASSGKEALNLTSLLSHLFTFHLTSSALVFSHINELLSPLSESNTELLLRLIRDCGPQLRTDDPSALKAVVTQTQVAAQALPAPVSVRTQFMLETITDLKNNKMRDSTATSSLTREHITKLRKALGTLNSRSLRTTEPLRLTLSDLRNSDRKGKWWLVGASWKGNSPPPTSTSYSTPSQTTNSVPLQSPESAPDYRHLAQSLSLNTPLSLSILTALASATTAHDAFIRLSKLRLKRAQEPEVARVLLRCCGAEDTFNIYYVDIIKRLCGGEHERSWKKGMEFAMWGFLRRCGDGDDGEDEYEMNEGRGGEVQMTELYNVAKLYAHLVYASTLSLTVLRPLDLLMLSEKAGMFVEVMMVNVLVLCKGQEREVERVFERLRDAKGVVSRLRAFLKRSVRESDLVGKKEREMVRKAVKTAARVLEALSVEES